MDIREEARKMKLAAPVLAASSADLRNAALQKIADALKEKKEEIFKLLKRTTNPTTIYKKQKLDRDDVLDLGAHEGSALAGLDVLEVNDVPHTAVPLDGNTLTEIASSNHESIPPLI